jgi:hypothetical protein
VKNERERVNGLTSIAAKKKKKQKNKKTQTNKPTRQISVPQR